MNFRAGRQRHADHDANWTKSQDEGHAVAAKAGRTGPASSLGTPCAGKWALFDSTELADHIEARALCETCPIIADCLLQLDDLKRTASKIGQPEGTWAGQLLVDHRPIERRALLARAHQDDERYDDSETNQAHRQYLAGNRDEWTKAGERVFQMRKKRQSRRKAS